MKLLDIPFIRLHNQRLDVSDFKNTVDVVSWLGAVQAQDYTGAKWAVGLRCNGLKDSDVDAAFRKGEILRTHIMRPTWHFVTPKDIRWLLKLTAPRVQQVCAYYYRKAGISAETLEKSILVISQALKGNVFLTRDELKLILEEENISTKTTAVGSRLGFLLMNAELEGVICSGGRKGNHFTYALLEERVPQVKEITEEGALVELIRRYYTSHGPATIKDCVWWSGLTVADVMKGISLVSPSLRSAEVEGVEYWFRETNYLQEKKRSALFLSNYDEYIGGYTNHDVVFNRSYSSLLGTLYPHAIVVDGQVVGGWKREFKKGKMVITTQYFREVTALEISSIHDASDKFSDFLGIPVEIQ
jgi:hypothetical protein